MAIQISDHKLLVGAMYAPFCRTRAVPIEEWDKDIKNMADLGYTCLHGFAEWHDIEAEKGIFDFTQIDHMVFCAAKHGLTAIINIATQNSVGFYSPRWLMDEYKGDGFVDNQGVKNIPGQFRVPCIDDPFYQTYANRYLSEVAKHFAKDKRVGGFVIWGEPVIFRPGSWSAPICYCEHTVAKFRRWLNEKYGSIEHLNNVWSSEGPSGYHDFTDVLPPTGFERQQGGYHSWDDWREFMEQNLADYIRRADRIFKENGAIQPTIVEMLTGLNNSIDSWKLAKTADIIGISCFDRPGRDVAMYMAIADSMAKMLDKSTFVIESPGGPAKFTNSITPSEKELKSALLQRIGYGSKGLMYWCYRPRISDMEGNDFGLVKPNGKVLPRAIETGKLAKIVNTKQIKQVYLSSMRKADTAIFMSQSMNHLMEADKMGNAYLDAVRGAYRLFSDIYETVDFICGEEILKGSLMRYKHLILPCSYIISQTCIKVISDFVSAGGVVLSDYCLAEKQPGGMCYTELPGGGFDKVFGFERDDVRQIENERQLIENDFGIRLGSMTERITVHDAVVLARYGSEPMLTENYFGSGRAVYLACRFFAEYYGKPEHRMREKLKAVLGLKPQMYLQKNDLLDDSPLILSRLTCGGKISIITITNTKNEFVTDTLNLPEAGRFSVVDGDSNTHWLDGGIELSFEPYESIAIYRK